MDFKHFTLNNFWVEKPYLLLIKYRSQEPGFSYEDIFTTYNRNLFLLRTDCPVLPAIPNVLPKNHWEYETCLLLKVEGVLEKNQS